MKKIIISIMALFLFVSCTYFKVQDAIEQANNGNYIQSLTNLSRLMANGNRSAIEAFESVYPKAEIKYADEIRANKDVDLVKYTRGLVDMLKVQDIYLNLPDKNKRAMKIVTPSFEQRNEIKRELANCFYTLGERNPNYTYLEKLRTYGFFKEAQNFNVDNLKKITSKYEAAKKNATGVFYININDAIHNNITSNLYSSTVLNLVKYPIFKVGTATNYNLQFNINVSNFIYTPSTVKTETGTDSFDDTVTQTVMKKVVETEKINGKEIQITKWIPSYEDVKVKVYYRYIKYTKISTVSFDLGYNISEKNGTAIYSGVKNVVVSDKVQWTQYFPMTPFIGIPPVGFPISEPEKFNISREALIDKGRIQAQKEINSVIEKLYSNQNIKF